MGKGKRKIPTGNLPDAVFIHGGPCEGPEGGVYCVWCLSDDHCGCLHLKQRQSARKLQEGYGR